MKSIITILLIGALVVLAFMYPDTYEETMKSAVTMVVTFYFAHQQEKLRKEFENNGKPN